MSDRGHDRNGLGGQKRNFLGRLGGNPPYLPPGHSKGNLKGRARCPQRAGEKGKMKFHDGGLRTNRPTLPWHPKAMLW